MGGAAGRPVSDGSLTFQWPRSGGAASQYGCVYGVSLGSVSLVSTLTSLPAASGLSTATLTPPGRRTSRSVAAAVDRLSASTVTTISPPGTATKSATVASL